MKPTSCYWCSRGFFPPVRSSVNPGAWVHPDTTIGRCVCIDPPSMERRVLYWIETRLGVPNLHPRERAMRLLEEAIELAQAEGITAEMVHRQAAHVFSRPRGIPLKEAGGVAVCLLGWCGAHGVTMQSVAEAELTRIEAKPLDAIRGSLARKQDAGLVTAIPEGGE